MVIDGHGNEIESIENYSDFLCTFLHDDRAKFEMREMVDSIEHLLDVYDEVEDICLTLENVLCNLEAIFGYESGAFKGSDYFAESYWKNFSHSYTDFGVRK